MAQDVRLKVLSPVEQRHHRYARFRVLTQGITIGVLFAVPISGAARLDLYGGAHRMAFAEATWREGLAAVILGIAAMYIVTFLINFGLGRMFCGWGCPVGFLNRLCDVSELKTRKGVAAWKRHRDRLGPWAHAFLLSFSCVLWWTSAEAFAAIDSPRALAASWGVTAGGVALLWGLGKYWRWGFCMRACPVGLYYSFIAPSDAFGINFREATADGKKDACLHCDACIRVCPVDLNPMDLMQPVPARGGVSISDAPANNHCLKCGDCIQACEMMIEGAAARRGIAEVPLRFGFYDGAQRVTRGVAEPAEVGRLAAGGPAASRAGAAESSRMNSDE